VKLIAAFFAAARNRLHAFFISLLKSYFMGFASFVVVVVGLSLSVVYILLEMRIISR
jgi:hypothetical protein